MSKFLSNSLLLVDVCRTLGMLSGAINCAVLMQREAVLMLAVFVFNPINQQSGWIISWIPNYCVRTVKYTL